MKANYELIKKNVKKEMVQNGINPIDAEIRANRMIADMILEESQKVNPENRSAFVFDKIFGGSYGK